MSILTCCVVYIWTLSAESNITMKIKLQQISQSGEHVIVWLNDWFVYNKGIHFTEHEDVSVSDDNRFCNPILTAQSTEPNVSIIVLLNRVENDTFTAHALQ